MERLEAAFAAEIEDGYPDPTRRWRDGEYTYVPNPICLAFRAVRFGASAVEVYDRMPDSIHARERYVIYSHGLDVEAKTPSPFLRVWAI